MKPVSPDAAVAAIPDGSRVFLPHGAVEPVLIYEALQRGRERFRDLHLYSGMQFGGYPFLRAGLGENFRYATWQASPRLREHFASGRIDFLPMRIRDVVRIAGRHGPLRPDVLIVQTTLPRGNEVSLGISVSLYRELVAAAGVVIAEMNSRMPWTRGDSVISLDDVDLGVESDLPLGTYAPPRQGEREARIAERVLELVPEGAWVQIGVGAAAEAVLARLHEVAGVNLHSGMLTGGLIECVARARHPMRVVTGEVCGGPELYALVHENPQIELHPTTLTHDLLAIARLPRFVAINSAVEVDLHGQVNGETIDGVQVSGVGGCLDFIEGAQYSPGGLSIIALPSTTEDRRRAKIVAQLSAGTPATVPRYCADVVVTEHGVAHLRGKTLHERAEALTAVADPEFRPARAEATARALDERKRES